MHTNTHCIQRQACADIYMHGLAEEQKDKCHLNCGKIKYPQVNSNNVATTTLFGLRHTLAVSFTVSNSCYI